LITLSSGSAAKAGGSGATTLEAQLSSTYLVGTLHAEKTVAEPTSAQLTSVVSRARGGLQLYKSARTSTSGLNWTELNGVLVGTLPCKLLVSDCRLTRPGREPTTTGRGPGSQALIRDPGHFNRTLLHF